ncbi:hypothetical protein J6590_004933 [Homalodisca vitripennis]|nr:hypothetical protein J6590_004933 [Homalodisca vitripennis]
MSEQQSKLYYGTGNILDLKYMSKTGNIRFLTEYGTHPNDFLALPMSWPACLGCQASITHCLTTSKSNVKPRNRAPKQKVVAGDESSYTSLTRFQQVNIKACCNDVVELTHHIATATLLARRCATARSDKGRMRVPMLLSRHCYHSYLAINQLASCRFHRPRIVVL